MHNLTTKYYWQQIKNYLWHYPQNLFANIILGFPSRKLTLIGVTGTDGKTTTANLIQQTLLNAGIKSEAFTTINSPGLHTTSPDAKVIQQAFLDMSQKGITHCVLETTAHGLDQFRFLGCHFKVSVITNITHEHLDDFPNLELYTKAKTHLFNHSDIKIFNADDNSYPYFKKLFPKHLSYSIEKKSDFQATNINIDKQKMSFIVNGEKIITDSNYHYQIYNILAACTVISSLDLPLSLITKTVIKFPETKGRREIVENNLRLKTIIDFAHTPNALEVTLSSLRQTTPGRLIVIFGATGGRDKSKRPIMGKNVSEIADIAFITADDTRSEKIEEINQQIIAGIDPKKSIEMTPDDSMLPNTKKFLYFNIPNRQDAFNLAIKFAKAGDTVIACGKGHETTILHGTTEYPWSEAEAFRTAFRLRSQNV